MKVIVSWLLAMSLVFAAQLSMAEEEESWGDSDTKEETATETAKEGEGAATGEEATEEEPVAEYVEPGDYPTAEIKRPLALPPLMLEMGGGMNIDIIDPGPGGGGSQSLVGIFIDGGFGVMEYLELGIRFPLRFAPKFKAGDFMLYGLYELPKMLEDKLLTAIRLSTYIPMSQYNKSVPGNFAMLLDGMAKFIIHDMFAAVGDFGFGFTAGGNAGSFIINLDLGLMVQPMEPLAITTGFGMRHYTGINTVVPLFLRGQYTLMNALDAYFELSFFDLNGLGARWVSLIFGSAYRFGM